MREVDAEAPLAPGMTLVEMLVALVVFGLLLASLAAVMHLTSSFTATRMRGADAYLETVPVLDFLEILIGDARPVRFEGKPDRLTVVAPLAGQSAKVTGLQVIRLSFQGEALRVDWTPYRSAALPMNGHAGSTTLLQDLSDVRFHYLGRAGPGNSPTWRDQWVELPDLPALIDITITRPHGGLQSEVIVAPRVTGTASRNEP